MRGHKILVAGIAAVAMLWATGTAIAQNLGLDKLEDQQRSQLEIYFDYADRAQSQQDWLRIAQFGVQTVVARWESSAAALVDQGIDLRAERDRVQDDFDALLQQRYAQWLIQDAFSAQAPAESAALARSVLQADLSKLYRTDENGIIYDTAGDPEMYQTANLETDTADWEATVSETLQTELSAWDDHAAAIRTDLLGSLPEGTAFDGQFTATEAQYRAAYARELNTAFQRDEARFLNARTRDQLSLRKKSEDETATSVVSQIIAGANADMAAGLVSLRDSLSTSHAATPEGEVAIDPAAWQESFRREFDKGMARWTKAEQDLLIERAQWEKSVTDQFQAGEREWADAYQQLQAARVAWESELRNILDTGKASWQVKQSDLSAAIDQARLDLNHAVDERSTSLDTQIANVTQVYSQAANILRTADSSLAYWKEQTANDDVNGEIAFWTSTRDTYQAYYASALTFLADTATEINGGEPGSTSYTDIFGTDAVDTHYLDDYQVALLAAQATQGYWQKQVTIAAAVAAYAHENSSLRPTEAQTEQGYEEALRVFQTRQTAYQQALAALTACGNDLPTNRQKVADLNDQLQELDGKLKEARESYQDTLDIWSTKDSTPFRQQLQGYYQELLKDTGLGPAADDMQKNEAVAYGEYLAAVNEMGLEQEVNGAAQTVSQLVLGDTDSGQSSLQDLSDSARKASQWKFSTDSASFTASLETLALAPEVINQLTLEFHDSDADSDKTPEQQALARLSIVGFVRQLSAQREDDLQCRLAEIALLTSPDLQTWAAAEGITVGADFEDTEGKVIECAKGSVAQAFLDDATAQKQILDSLAADPLNVGGFQTIAAVTQPKDIVDSRTQILSAIFKTETGLSAGDLGTEASRRSAALQKIIDVMEAVLHSSNPDLTAHGAEIRNLAESDELARQFLSGSSMFAFAGADYGSLVLGGASPSDAPRGSIASLMTKDAAVAPAVREGLARQAISQAQVLLVERGIATAASADTVVFRNPEDVWRDIWSAHPNAAFVETWLQQVEDGIASVSLNLPQPVAAQLQSLLQSLSDLFALHVVNLGGAVGASQETQGALGRLSDRMESLQEDLAKLQGNAESTANDPVSLLLVLRDVQTIQGTGGFDSSVGLAVSLSAGDVSARFVAQSAVGIARSLIGECGSVAPDSTAIHSAVSAFLSSDGLRELVGDPWIAPLVAGIRSSLETETASLLLRVAALTDPSHADWNALGEDVCTEYANAVWNTYSPAWFAGAKDDGSRDVLVATGATQLSVLHSIDSSLSARWGAQGIDAASWNEYLLSTYYGGKKTSLAFDQEIPLLEASIESNAAMATAYTGINRSFLSSTPTEHSLLSRYFNAAGMKAAIDAAIDGQSYDEQKAQGAARAYIASHPDADSSVLSSFMGAYLDLFRGATGTVDVNSRRDSWLQLLRGELDGSTLSALSTTTSFKVVAAADLLAAVCGGLADDGLTGCDFGLLKEVLIDQSMTAAEQAVLSAGTSAGVNASLNDYLATMTENGIALNGDSTDRSFELARLYTQGYLACNGNADAQGNWRELFRGRYLSGSLKGLDVARGYEDSLRTLGSAAREAWFAQQALSDAGRDRASAIVSTNLSGRVGIDANEKALALGLNYDLAQLSIDEAERVDLAGWMLSISGVGCPSAIDSLIKSADGSNDTPPPSTDALLLLLGSPEAALWILKRKILAGKKTDADAGSVSPSVREQTQAFQTDYSLENGYVAAAESGPVPYGAERAGTDSFTIAVRDGALASMKAWQDPVFASPLSASANDIIDKTAENQSAQTKTALDYISNILVKDLTAMTHAQPGLAARLSFEKQAEDLAGGMAGSPLAYRAYLSDLLMQVKSDDATDKDNTEQHLAPATSAGQVTTQVDDAAGIYEVAPGVGAGSGTPGPLYENAVLEATNQFRGQAERFNTTVAADRSMDRSRLNAFSTTLSPVFADASSGRSSALLADWEGIQLNSFDATGAAKAAVDSSTRVLNGLQASIASLKRQISLLGSALSQRLIDGQKSSAAAAAPLKDKLDQLVAARDSLNTAYTAAVAAFSATSGTYDGLYSQARDAAAGLETARFELQKAEAITTFASTGYLDTSTGQVTSAPEGSDGQDSASLAVDPDQRVTAAKAGLLRAQAALDALRSLYGGTDQPADFAQGNGPEQVAYRNAFEQYQEQYGAYLAFERLSSLLGSATAKQQQKVADAQDALDSKISELFVDAPGDVTFADAGAANTKAFVQVTFNAEGLPDFSYGTASTAAQQSALKDYLTGKASHTYASDRETWLREMAAYITDHHTDFIENWGLAFQYQISVINPSGSGDKDIKKLFATYQVNEGQVITEQRPRWRRL